jgi:hypothetical protein
VIGSRFVATQIPSRFLKVAPANADSARAAPVSRFLAKHPRISRFVASHPSLSRFVSHIPGVPRFISRRLGSGSAFLTTLAKSAEMPPIAPVYHKHEHKVRGSTLRM